MPPPQTVTTKIPDTGSKEPIPDKTSISSTPSDNDRLTNNGDTATTREYDMGCAANFAPEKA